jgi:transposase
MLANTMRGPATEFGLTVPKGIQKLDELMVLVNADEIIPKQARQAITGLHDYCNDLREGIETFEAEIVAHARRDGTARRLATIPGIGRITKTGNREIRKLLVLGATSMVLLHRLTHRCAILEVARNSSRLHLKIMP